MDTRCFTIYISVVMTVSVSPARDPLNLQPAEVFGSSSVKAGGDILLKCIIIDRSLGTDTLVNLYLCKDGVGVRTKPLINKDEHTFILRNVSALDSGNYSCVYSVNRYAAKDVKTSGQKSIQVHVTDDPLHIWPAHISGGTSVKKGEDLQLQCVILEKSMSSYQLFMYLCKNGVAVRTEAPAKRDKHIFMLRNVSVLDSGKYSCVYSVSRYAMKNVTALGYNSIQVLVTDPQWLTNLIRLLSSIGVVIFACLVVVFDVYSTKRGYSIVLSSTKSATRLDLNDQ